MPSSREPTVEIRVTESAGRTLAKAGAKVRDGILRKAKAVVLNPRAGKPLTGALKGYYRVTFGRIRAVLRCDGKTPVGLIVAALPRSAGSTLDPYTVAERALQSGGKEIEALFLDHLRAYGWTGED
jgi:mRNA-degrading endonuclease RelE of RelBE toxin-antitoxin system